MATWKNRLSEIRPKEHLVELYENDETLTTRVSHYVREGLERDEGVIAIATAPHRDAIVGHLVEDLVDVHRAVQSGQLVLLDAQETLSQFLVDGRPDPERFEQTVGAALNGVSERRPKQGLRAYGEMVDLLWSQGNLSAAIRLEQLWERLIHDRRFPLLCAYRMGVLEPSFTPESFQAVLAAHGDRVPVGGEALLEQALEQAMEEVLGREKLEAMRPLMTAAQHLRGALCPAEAAVLWLGTALSGRLDEVLTRARLHYAARCAEAEPA